MKIISTKEQLQNYLFIQASIIFDKLMNNHRVIGLIAGVDVVQEDKEATITIWGEEESE